MLSFAIGNVDFKMIDSRNYTLDDVSIYMDRNPGPSWYELGFEKKGECLGYGIKTS